MVRPNFIPRTLRGVGGKRFFNIPGVIYPQEVLKVKAGTDRKSGLPYNVIPNEWGVSTREAAQMLSCTPSAARNSLHKKRVTFRLVSRPGLAPSIYWKRDQVEGIIKNRLPLLPQTPQRFVTVEEALNILHVRRSSLYRYVRNGKLKEVKVRRMSSKGPRVISLYNRAQVRKLSARIRAVRLKEEELSRLRQHLF